MYTRNSVAIRSQEKHKVGAVWGVECGIPARCCDKRCKGVFGRVRTFEYSITLPGYNLPVWRRMQWRLLLFSHPIYDLRPSFLSLLLVPVTQIRGHSRLFSPLPISIARRLPFCSTTILVLVPYITAPQYDAQFGIETVYPGTRVAFSIAPNTYILYLVYPDCRLGWNGVEPTNGYES